jgi:hypothetical protein
MTSYYGLIFHFTLSISFVHYNFISSRNGQDGYMHDRSDWSGRS